MYDELNYECWRGRRDQQIVCEVQFGEVCFNCKLSEEKEEHFWYFRNTWLVSSKWQIGKILIFWIDRDGLVVGVTIYYAGLSLLIGFWDLWTFIKETYQTRIEWVMTHFVDILGKLSSSAQLLRATINLCYWYNKKSKTVKIMEHRVAEVFQIFCEGHFCLRRKAANFCHPMEYVMINGFWQRNLVHCLMWTQYLVNVRTQMPSNLLMKESPG